MEVLEALTKGRDFLILNPWVKYGQIRVMGNGVHGYCAAGALKYGAFLEKDLNGIGGFTELGVYFQAKAALDRAVQRLYGSPYIEHFNDLWATEKFQIVDAYNEAIRDEEERYAGTRDLRSAHYPPYGGGGEPADSSGSGPTEGQSGEDRGEGQGEASPK